MEDDKIYFDFIVKLIDKIKTLEKLLQDTEAITTGYELLVSQMESNNRGAIVAIKEAIATAQDFDLSHEKEVEILEALCKLEVSE